MRHNLPFFIIASTVILAAVTCYIAPLNTKLQDLFLEFNDTHGYPDCI